MRRRDESMLAVIAAAVLVACSATAYSQPVTGWGPIPNMQNVQTGLLEVISHLRLTHAQHEQIERIIANETMQLALARGNSNLSVAKIFIREDAIRIEARRQIESILTPQQKEIVARHIIHEMEEDQRWAEDPMEFFSIPAIY